MKSKIILLIVILLVLCGCNSKPAVRFGEEVMVVDDMEIPAALGESQFSDQDLQNLGSLTDLERKEKIKTYADAIRYLNNKIILDNKSVIDQISSYIIDDYDDAKTINIFSNDTLYYLLSIKADDKYYLLDPYTSLQGNKEWLYDINVDSGSFSSVDSMIESLKAAYSDENVYIFATNIGQLNNLRIDSNELFYSYKGYDYLITYGTPQLSDRDIEDLINKMNEGDYETVRNSICTIPDFINLFISSGFKPNEGIVSTSEYRGPNVGHIYYGDEGYTIEGGRIEYTISGVESMILKEGQCDSTASLFHYFFKDRFDEVGYVLIHCFDSNKVFGYACHAINYFKTNNKYYLFSPSYALTGDNAWEAHKDLWAGADSIEELAQRLYDSEYPTGKVAALMLFEYDGSLASGRAFNDKTDPSKNIITLPEGSDVKVCYGIGYDFIKPMHSTEEDHIIGVQTK